MAVARWLETDTNTNKDISSAVSIGAYTADADRMVVVDVSLDAVAGNGDYVIYVTRQINGAGSAYVLLPKTTCAAASGETAIAMQSGMISVRSGDVLTVYVDGLAGDTATPDTVVRFFEVAALQPTDAGRTLDIAATGEASANVTKQAGVAVAAADANGNVPVVLYGTQPAVTFGQVKITANVNHEGALHIRNNATLGHGVDAYAPDEGLVISGANRGVRLQGGTNQALFLLSDTAAATVYIEGPTTGGKGLAISSPSDGTPGTNSPSGIYIQTEGGHPGIVFDFTDPATAIKVLGSEHGDWSVDAMLDDILVDTGTTIPGLLAAELSSSSDSTTSGAITRTRGNTWTINATIGAITGYTSLWFTAKWDRDDPDISSVLQIKLNSPSASDGLLYVNGAAASDSTKGSITVSDDTTGAIIIAVDETITQYLPPAGLYYDIQVLNSGTVTTPDSGTLTITADVTRSVT